MKIDILTNRFSYSLPPQENFRSVNGKVTLEFRTLFPKGERNLHFFSFQFVCHYLIEMKLGISMLEQTYFIIMINGGRMSGLGNGSKLIWMTQTHNSLSINSFSKVYLMHKIWLEKQDKSTIELRRLYGFHSFYMLWPAWLFIFTVTFIFLFFFTH